MSTKKGTTPKPKSTATPKPTKPEATTTPAPASKPATPLKSILKKPKPLNATPEPAVVPLKKGAKSAMKAPTNIAQPKRAVQSARKAQAIVEDDDDSDEEGGFDVASQIKRALGTPKSAAAATPKSGAKPRAATPARSKTKTPVQPLLSESDDEEDGGAMSDGEEEDVPPTQMKNWKALASKTLTMDTPAKKAHDDLGAGLPAVPRSDKKGAAQAATPATTTKKSPKAKEAGKPAVKATTPQQQQPIVAVSGKKANGANKQADVKAAAGKQKAATEQKTQPQAKKLKASATETKKQPPPQKVQMFEDSDDEAALDFDGEGDEGDEMQEAAITRALRREGDFDLGEDGQGFQDEYEGDEGDEDDLSDDYENENLSFEKAAKRLAAMEARVEKEADAEMQTNMQEMQVFKLPSGQEIEQETLMAPDLTALNQRIQDVLFTLSDFRKKKEADRSRTEYMECLARDLTTYYGYLPELIDRFLEMFSPAEAVEFLMANEAQRPVTLRVNTLKTRRGDLIQALSKRGIHVEALADWTKVGCKVTMSKLSVGATPEYLAGHYVLQSAASFLPVMALAPQEHEKVLDMCASPGGKSTYIAALMKNTGLLVANDANVKRLASLTGNIHRLGVRNAVVTNFDGRKLRNHFALFDRILLDAPCSGLGVISKDPSVKTTKTTKDIQRASHIQKELALAAIDMLDAESKTGGYLVYSTCSIAVEENEEVVDYILSRRHVKLVETNIPFGVVGMTRYRSKQFHPSVALSRRFYPHVHNMDGFFVCKMKKLANGAKTVAAAAGEEEEVVDPTSTLQPEAKAVDAPPASAPAGKGKGTKAKSSKKKGPKATQGVQADVVKPAAPQAKPKVAGKASKAPAAAKSGSAKKRKGATSAAKPKKQKVVSA